MNAHHLEPCGICHIWHCARCGCHAVAARQRQHGSTAPSIVLSVREAP